MAWSIDPKKVGSLNDAPQFLQAGTKNYKIESIKLAADKNDPTGRTQMLSVMLSDKDGNRYQHYFRTGDANPVTAEIALKSVVALFAAVGYKGEIKVESFPKAVGKWVEIVVTARQGKGQNSGKTYTNIDRINPVAAASATTAPETEEEEEEEEPTPADNEEEEEEEADEEPAPAPAQSGQQAPWMK